jgi:MSHA biogenesis protein MshP
MKRTKPFLRNVQQGFAAIAAIFLVVVLAALGGFMLTFSNTQQLTSAQDIQGTRAYWAARTGLEWAIAGVFATAPVLPATTPLATCPSLASTPALTPPAAVDGFTLTITCTPRAYTEDGITRTIFQLDVTATAGGATGSISNIERSVSASLEQPQP